MFFSLPSAGSNFNSSRSSLATDFSVPENGSEMGSPGFGNGFPADLDGDLEKHILEDSEDMIIPDDMQRFLNERSCNNYSQPTSEDMQVRERGVCMCGRERGEGLGEGFV
jgi:hypothetical protein